MTPAAFQSWLDRMVYNVEDAADALGVTTRTIWRYLDGTRAIPLTVQKLCECLEREKAGKRGRHA